MENFEDNHVDYSYAFVETLINNSRIDEAYRYSYKLRKKGMNFFQSDIIIISKLIKNKNFQETHKYLNSMHRRLYSFTKTTRTNSFKLDKVRKIKFNIQSSARGL